MTRVPPLASVAIIDRHRDRRHRDLPWPIDTEIVSPAYHFSPVRRRFHSVDGTRPCTSFGRSMPLFTPRPSSVAHLWMRSMPDHVADRVEVHVARLLDRVPQVDRAVAARLPALERAAVERRARRRSAP